MKIKSKFILNILLTRRYNMGKREKKGKFYYVYRSALTGRFVSKEYAEQHKGITIREKRFVK